MNKDQTRSAVAKWVNARYLEYKQIFISKHHRDTNWTEFAKSLNIDPATMLQWKNAARLPGYDNLLKLAALGTEIFEVAGETRPAWLEGVDRLTPDMLNLFRRWPRLRHDQQQKLLQLLDELERGEHDDVSASTTDSRKKSGNS